MCAKSFRARCWIINVSTRLLTYGRQSNAGMTATFLKKIYSKPGKVWWPAICGLPNIHFPLILPHYAATTTRPIMSPSAKPLSTFSYIKITATTDARHPSSYSRIVLYSGILGMLSQPMPNYWNRPKRKCATRLSSRLSAVLAFLTKPVRASGLSSATGTIWAEHHPTSSTTKPASSLS